MTGVHSTSASAYTGSDQRGKKLLIIGASSGIGRSLAELAAGAGAELALIDRDGAALSSVGGPAALYRGKADLRDRQASRQAIRAAGAALGSLDGLLITAGVGNVTPFDQVDEDDWDRTLDINLSGIFRACQAALPDLRKSPAGAIVLVASATGLMPAVAGQTAYAASKAGLIGFARALSLELAPQIRVNTVCPGPVDTPLLPASFRDRLTQPGSGYPMQRAALPEEVARLMLFLASNSASYINGSAIAIDGGRAMH